MTITSDALWDTGKWDDARWDMVWRNADIAIQESPDVWVVSVYVLDYLLSAYTNGSDGWGSTTYVQDRSDVAIQEVIDFWAVNAVAETDVPSFWNEKPDIWTVAGTVTLFPPVYNAGGSWAFHYWGDRLPDWKARRANLWNAVENWRYFINGFVKNKDDAWGVTAETAHIEEKRLQQQIVALFGDPTDYNADDEEVLWLL